MSPKKNGEEDSTTRNPRGINAEAELGGVKLVCRVPAIEDWDRYLWNIKKKDSVVAAKELMLQTNEGMPDEELEALFERFPAMPEAFCEKLEELAGGDVECDSTLDAITAKFGTGSKAEVFDFHAPTQPDHDSLIKSLKDPKGKPGEVMRTFVKRCADRDVGDLFERYPASVGPITAALRQIAGASFEITVKKG